MFLHGIREIIFYPKEENTHCPVAAIKQKNQIIPSLLACKMIPSEEEKEEEEKEGELDKDISVLEEDVLNSLYHRATHSTYPILVEERKEEERKEEIEKIQKKKGRNVSKRKEKKQKKKQRQTKKRVGKKKA